ncbi:lamin Dm0-like [Anopheles ziemanni]|uniref:lamin Dm0-like n=1 Tax=Anopheles coustani TaxID=139045 RepID=UPI00265A8C3C|nr:lamin Dm0-like [Anopheles coustani]XP_058167974.1 lamin Dm0-like [Anopheles ziemanni]
MSQKMKKPSTKPSSTTTTTSASSTAASQHPMAPPSSAQSVSSSASSVSSASESMETALSPSRRSRLHEKNSLMNLNDRLACYIERVRFLEQENSRLSLELTNFQETAHREVSGLKSIYEHELADARKLLDETARDKAKVEIDAKRYWEENEQLRVKLNRRTKELSELEKSARASESRCVELTASYNTLCSERKKLQEELSEVEKEADALRRSAEAMRKDLEQETLLRVDLENNVQSLREELTFKDQIHSQELSESKLRRQSEISEIDGFLMEQYETKLQQTLQDLRDQYDQQLRHNRDELGERFEGRIQDLEDRLGEERARHEAEKATLSDALDRMRNEMAVQLKDYQDLMDIKVSLDMEIAAYDKLLSSEETRLNMAPSVSSSSSAGVFSSSASRIFRTPSLKRKRNTLDESLDYSVLASAKGDIEVTEADPEGRFVRITNRSKQEYRLDGWQLVRRPTDAPEVCFRFPKSAKIEGNGMVTVWASVANRKPDPPTDLVMKSAALWTVTDTMATVLVNGEGEEVALLERHRTVRAPKDKYFHEESGGRLAVSSKSSPKGTTNGVSRNDEQCCVM